MVAPTRPRPRSPARRPPPPAPPGPTSTSSSPPAATAAGPRRRRTRRRGVGRPTAGQGCPFLRRRRLGGDGAADAGDEVGDLVVRETALAHLEVVGVRARQRTRLCLFSQMRGVGRDVKAREAMHLGQGNICISDKGISEVRKHTVMGCRDIKRWRSNGLRSIDLKFWGSAVRLRSYCE